MKTLLRMRLPLCLLALAASAPLMAQERRVSPDQINSYWILLNRSVDVDVPNSGRNIYKPGCVAVTFTIGSDGIPRDIKAAKSVPDSDLGKVAESAVKGFRYGPSLTNRAGEPVATYYVVPFNGPSDKAGQQQLMAPCQIPGYDQG
jgi:outer membrane biosynthesis protein TonB